MERRKVLSIIGTGTLGAGVLGFVYLMDRGYIDIEDDAPVNEEIDGGTASWTFEADDNDVIRIDWDIRRSGTGQGELRLVDPTGETVIDRDISLSVDREIPHSVDEPGTYELFVDVGDATVSLRVSTAEWEP